MKNHSKMFCFTTFHTKLWLLQNQYVLGSIYYMDLLEFMMELDISNYLNLENIIKFLTGLDTF